MSLVPADAVTVLGNREASPKVASTGAKSWLTLQPNPGGIQGLRATYESVSRQILSKNLTPEAGDIVGMSVAPSIVQDVTMDQLTFWSGDAWRCVPKHAGNKGQSLYRSSAVVAAVAAELDLAGPGTNIDTVIEAVTPGTGGHAITIAFEDGGSGVGLLSRVGTAFTFAFEASVTTVANFEAAVGALVGADALIAVKTPGTGASTLATTDDEFAATALAGGVNAGFTVAALGDLAERTLVRARGFTTQATNALLVVGDDAAAGAIRVTANLTAETNPANAIVEVAGCVGEEGDYELDANNDLICTSDDFTTWSPQPGQLIRIGGPTAGSQFATALGDEAFAEVDPTRVVTAKKIPLRNHSWTPAGADDGSGKAIMLRFTAFCRQYPLGTPNFSKATAMLEMEQPGAGTADASSFRYAKGLRVGNAEIDAPLKSKLVLTLGFIGLDLPDPVLQAERPADTATALEPLRASMFDTTSDYKHLRLAVRDTNAEVNGTNSHIQSWRFAQGLNLSPVEVHGVLGATDHIDGQMDPTLSLTTYMATDEFVKAVKANTNHRFCAIFGNEDGGWALNLPSGKLRGDEEEMAAGEGVMVSIEFVPHREPSSGILSSLSTFADLS